MNSTLAFIFLITSQSLALPNGLLNAICNVESNQKIQAITWNDGGTPSLGLCQIKLSTARMLGFGGSAEALWKDPHINIYWAGKYLKYQLNRYHGNIDKAIAAYNAGIHRTNKKGLTKNRRYVYRVNRAWEEFYGKNTIQSYREKLENPIYGQEILSETQ